MNQCVRQDPRVCDYKCIYIYTPPPQKKTNWIPKKWWFWKMYLLSNMAMFTIYMLNLGGVYLQRFVAPSKLWRHQGDLKGGFEINRTKRQVFSGRALLMMCVFFFVAGRGNHNISALNPSDFVRHQSWGSTMKNWRCQEKRNRKFLPISVVKKLVSNATFEKRPGCPWWCFCLSFVVFFGGMVLKLIIVF